MNGQRGRIGSLVLGALVVCALMSATAAAEARSRVKIAVAGVNYLQYLPVILARELGEFDAAGIDVDLVGFSGGSTAATALISGSVDVTAGYYEHALVFATKGKSVRAFTIITRMRGEGLFVSPSAVDKIKSVKDLAGKKVGVTSPGSSTDFLLRYVLRKNGVDPASVGIIGIGEPASTVAAVSRGLVDAALVGEPGITTLEQKYGRLNFLMDTRTEEGSLALFGTDYPAASLYSTSAWLDSHADEASRLSRAILSTLRWMRAHTPQEIAAKMPAEIVGPDKAFYAAVYTSLSHMYSEDGRTSLRDTGTVRTLLADSVPELNKPDLDLKTTFTNSFAEEAGKQLGIPQKN